VIDYGCLHLHSHALVKEAVRVRPQLRRAQRVPERFPVPRTKVYSCPLAVEGFLPLALCYFVAGAHSSVPDSVATMVPSPLSMLLR
jgi:hypothetical protein